MHMIIQKIYNAVVMPAKAFRLRYLPLLMIYFAYGASGLLDLPLYFWVKESLDFSAFQLASVAVWVSLPWTIKMIFGQCVDRVKIFGSNRKVYVFIGALWTALGLVLLAGMANGNVWLMRFSGPFGIFLFAKMCIVLGFVIQDVTADTMSTEVVPRTVMCAETGEYVARSDAEVRHDLAMVQVLGRLALYAGIIVVAKLSGVLTGFAQQGTTFSYGNIFLIALVIPVMSCVGAICTRTAVVRERGQGAKERFDRAVLFGGIGLGLVSVCIGMGKIFFLHAQGIFDYSDELMFGISLVVLVWMVRHLMKDEAREKVRILYVTMIALFMYRLSPTVGASLTWWAIDVLKFDPSFFGTLQQISAVVPLVVLWLFSDLIATKSVRSVLIFLVIVGTIMSLPEIILYYGGSALQTHARSIIVFDTVLESPLANISMIPLLALVAYYAPASNRGTWFAVGTSLLNLALTGANLATKYLNAIFTVSREIFDPHSGQVVVAADYSQLGSLMLCRIIIVFVVPLAAIFVFLKKEDAPKNFDLQT